MRPIIGILDYGIGNLGCLTGVLKKLNFRIQIIKTPSQFDTVSTVMLPGVGSFGPCITSLENSNLITAIDKWSKSGNKIIGICIGMQLLATTSTEGGNYKGLNLIPGRIRQFNSEKFHIGWNAVEFKNIYDNLSSFQKQSFYFNHRYVFDTDKEYHFAKSEYTETLLAIVKKDNIWGLQFHPENSQHLGLNFLNQILRDEFLGQ